MTLNRQNIPSFHKVTKLHFPDYELVTLSTGIEFYTIKAGTEPVIRLDLVFDAGLIRQLKKAESMFAASMLSEGTKNKTAAEIADELDFYGSYFQTKSNADDAVATLYCLDKHLKCCLPLFLEALQQSIFPEKELGILKKNNIQKLSVNEKKNSYLCRKEFYKRLLGPNHPYAAFAEKSNLEQINVNDLRRFYEVHYKKGLKYALLSGSFSEGTTSLITDSLEKIDLKSAGQTKHILSLETTPGNYFVDKKSSVQSAIRVGKISIDRIHPDFRKLQLLNLVLGGYFGSRLMKNIREEKGLTYGIYSVLEPFKHASVWYVDTDLNSKNRDKGISEIYKEMELLCATEIPSDELEIAKNYILGSFLRSLDGPFSLADRLKILIDYNLKSDYYTDFVSTINNISASDLKETANKYLTPEQIVEVIAGKK